MPYLHSGYILHVGQQVYFQLIRTYDAKTHVVRGRWGRLEVARHRVECVAVALLVRPFLERRFELEAPRFIRLYRSFSLSLGVFLFAHASLISPSRCYLLSIARGCSGNLEREAQRGDRNAEKHRAVEANKSRWHLKK
jgi:hypothetical protein